MASGGNLRRIIVNTNAAPSAIGPYNQVKIQINLTLCVMSEGVSEELLPK